MINKKSLEEIIKFVSREKLSLEEEEHQFLQKIQPLLKKMRPNDDPYIRTEESRGSDRRIIKKNDNAWLELFYEEERNFFEKEVDLSIFKNFFYELYLNIMIPIGYRNCDIQGKLF